MRAPGVGVISHGLLTRRLSRPFAQSDGHARPGHVVRPPCDDSRRIHGFDEPPWLKEVLSALTWNALLLPVCKRDPSTPEPAANASFRARFPLFHCVRQQSDARVPQGRAARPLSCARRVVFFPSKRTQT